MTIVGCLRDCHDPTIVFGTYLGGTLSEGARAVAVDSGGNIYVTGSTESTNFPSVNPYQPVGPVGSSDVFVTKINPTGTVVLYSTYLEGNSSDQGLGIAVDSAPSTWNRKRYPPPSPVNDTEGGTCRATTCSTKGCSS